MADISNIDYAKLENRQIFLHGDIDDYASVAFILSSSLYKDGDYLNIYWIENMTVYHFRLRSRTEKQSDFGKE